MKPQTYFSSTFKYLGVAALAACLGLLAACNEKTKVKSCPDGLELDEKRSVTGKEQWCVSADGKRARWTEFHDGGKNRKQTCGFFEGKAEGSFLAWHPDGKVMLEGVYKGGNKIGKWSQKNKTGALVARGEYRFGRFIAGAPVGAGAKCEEMTP